VLTLNGRVARVAITRSVENRGPSPDQISFDVDLPAEAAAVSFRARAGSRWHTGNLMAADRASERYDQLTAVAGSGRGAALLTWNDPGVAVTAAPLRPGRRADFAIGAVAPLCYADGLLVAYLPLSPEPKADPAIEIRAPRRRWIVRSDQPAPRPLADRWARLGETCTPPEGDRHAALVVEAAPAAPLAAASASVTLASGRRLVLVEVDVPREIAPRPRAARVLFLIDASRSQTDDGVKAQLEMVRGYLAHVPDAEFEIIAYRRRASRLFGGLRPAGRAPALLDRVAAGVLARENGSNLDEALALAATVARGRPIRLVAFTDDRLRAGLDAAAMRRGLGQLPAGSIAHLVHLTGGRGNAFEWSRDDEHRFAGAVNATGGLVVTMSPGPPASAAPAMLGLVQPLRIDAFTVDGFQPFDSGLDVDGSLPAGAGLRMTAFSAPSSLVARGRIWGRELAMPIAVDAGLEAALPALMVGGDVWRDLEDGEQREVATRAGAVSVHTSYLVELDDRPSGHDDLIVGGCGCDASSSFHTGGHPTIGHGFGRIGAGKSPPDRHGILTGWLSAPIAACAALHGSAPIALTVETTVDEVVDVSVRARGNQALAECAGDAAWALLLDDRFDQEQATFKLRFDDP
jgi:hypothetical protein